MVHIVLYEGLRLIFLMMGSLLLIIIGLESIVGFLVRLFFGVIVQWIDWFFFKILVVRIVFVWFLSSLLLICQM